MKPTLNCIMLIDDDEPTNFLSSMIIEESGCTNRIEVKDSGKLALEYLTSSGQSGYTNELYPWPDLILLDINMPAMNGWEFLARYAELGMGHPKKVIIIMLTTSLNPDDKLKVEANTDVTDFKNKPFTKQILDEILECYFSNESVALPLPCK
ncbi:MAG: response regulator [Ferruginibacter sp.]